MEIAAGTYSRKVIYIKGIYVKYNPKTIKEQNDDELLKAFDYQLILLNSCKKNMYRFLATKILY